jgi:hypothetical protein
MAEEDEAPRADAIGQIIFRIETNLCTLSRGIPSKHCTRNMVESRDAIFRDLEALKAIKTKMSS